MISNEIRSEILKLGYSQGIYKPHKHIALLTALQIARENEHPRVYFDTLFTGIFSKYMNQFGGSNDRNRPYNPFFHLRSSSFWKLIPKPGKRKKLDELRTIGGPGLLNELVSHAELSDDMFLIIQNEANFLELESLVYACVEKGISIINYDENEESNFPVISSDPTNHSAPNPFVEYLNSLHSLDAGNQNAIAESQACNPDFSRIHVEHQLVQVITDFLCRESGESVILTGHAGDGKSTLALAVFKRLKKIDFQGYLPKPLQPREDIFLPSGVSIAIIKDLSEWSVEKRLALLDEVTKQGLRVLLISNTGALLDTFCRYVETRQLESIAELRPRLLKAMDAESKRLPFEGIGFRFYNLALHDNLDLGRQVLTRILSPENWDICVNQACQKQCPIYHNIQLLREQKGLAQERLFLAYRRMYEYGTRLTMRQLTAHLAYMLTAGLEYSDILSFSRKAEKPLLSDFLFYNRFFGDNGRGEYEIARQMPVIRMVRSQGFGERPSPEMERHLWLLTYYDNFHIGVALIEEEFKRLRRHGARLMSPDNSLTPDQAREQARRILFFLFMDIDAKRQRSFIQDFLGSLSILKWKDWQKLNTQLSLEDEIKLKKRVFHVLQEQFTGVRLSEEGSLGQNNLYITLSRQRQDIRQSAQVVLAQIAFLKDFKLSLTESNRISNRRDLSLVGQGWLSKIKLDLDLPFLDYVLARHHGQVGGILQAAYSNRLERLKADLIERCRSDNDNEMVLVRMRTNHTFRRQHFKVVKGRLEVSDA